MTLARAVLLAALLPALAQADQVYLREAEAPRAVFGVGVTAEHRSLDLTGPELNALSRLVGRRVDARSYPYLEVSGDAAQGARPLLGWIFLLDVIGQSLPISFAVGVRKDGALQDLEVMAYREPHGDEIRERRFRAQFPGKTLREPLAVGKDVDAITGATISSYSAAYAARKALALAEILRRRGGGAAP